MPQLHPTETGQILQLEIWPVSWCGLPCPQGAYAARFFLVERREVHRIDAGGSTVGLQIIVTTPAAECLKVQTWPSVGVAPCREQSGRAVLDTQLDVSDFGARSRPEKPPHRFPAMHAALHRVPRCFNSLLCCACACPDSADVSVEGVPSVASHFWLLLDLHLPRDAMQPCLVCITDSRASLR